MRRSPLLLAALAALAALAVLPGCRLSRAVGRGASSLVSSPREVKQNKHPVAKDARLAVVWVGHATALIQIEDKVILTDPVFTNTVGQLSKRIVQPGIDPKDLPPLDAVLVSNMHFDHLSLGSLAMIAPKVRALLLPRAGTAYLTDFSFPAYELGAWQYWEKDGLRISATPVHHPGWRYGIDEAWMTESATAYVIEYKGIMVYFGGDSAYDQANYVATAERFPKIDLALLPIAPIEPRNLMRSMHMDPGEALQAFIDLDAQTMVPIHFDTFVNSTDNPGDALRELDAAKKPFFLAPRVVAPLAIGERRVFIKPGEGKMPPPAATPAAAPAAPQAKSNVPDDDKFD